MVDLMTKSLTFPWSPEGFDDHGNGLEASFNPTLPKQQPAAW